MSARRYPVIIERTGTGYSAYSPDVCGCVAVGDTEAETRRNFQDALVEHFQAMREVGEPIPEPHTSVDYVEVPHSWRFRPVRAAVSKTREPDGRNSAVFRPSELFPSGRPSAQSADNTSRIAVS